MTGYPKILFFIDGAEPSLEERLAAEQMAPCRVAFRNAQLMEGVENPEITDGWFGDATPKIYRQRFPKAADAIKAFQEARVAEYNAREAAAKVHKQEVIDRDAAQARIKADELEAAALHASQTAKRTSEIADQKSKTAETQRKAAKAAEKVKPGDTGKVIDEAKKAGDGFGKGWTAKGKGKSDDAPTGGTDASGGDSDKPDGESEKG